MKVTQKYDEEVRVTDEAGETEKKVKLLFFSPALYTAISDFSIILSAALILENTSSKILIFNSMIQNFIFNKQLSSVFIEQLINLTDQSDDFMN